MSDIPYTFHVCESNRAIYLYQYMYSECNPASLNKPNTYSECNRALQSSVVAEVLEFLPISELVVREVNNAMTL